MRYISTRGRAPELAFDDVLLCGLARDGGLYVPAEWPRFDAAQLEAMKSLSYNELAFEVIKPFVGGTIDDDALKAIIAKAYSTFEGGEVAPLVSIGDDIHLMELFHGPTLAFKDVAMQMLGGLFDHVLRARGEHITIVGATSGDTGSAAIEACRDKDTLDIFMLHPDGRVSEVQRRQMTTVLADNVHNLAVRGTFDDCQDLVKAMFNDEPFRDRHHLSAVNSINWARVMVQIVYYFHAALHLGAPEHEISFTVPTGNFGNVFAGYAAMKMGVPVKKFVVAANANDILARFFDSGEMRMDAVVPTLSPSMDIQVSSNFERLLFDMMGRDGARVESTLTTFRKEGSFRVDQSMLDAVREKFDAARYDDKQTTETMRDLHAEIGMLIDPHTAVALAAAKAKSNNDGTPMVVLATAHPAKFPDAVEAATGIRPALPTHMADLYEREERSSVIDNSLSAIEGMVDDALNAEAAAS
ncbi:MAG: threonine synthase [Rhodospirillales bacterium]|nr:threonine synthase [Rhodospirillales bacterium]MBO6785660.1 threonine synthase [Rhodospirillales bacterium]